MVIDDLNLASKQIKKWKNNGLKVGLIFGLFEALHLGHLRLIFFANDNVDRLVIVGNKQNAFGRFSDNIKLCDIYIKHQEELDFNIINILNPDKIFMGEEWAFIDNHEYPKLQEINDSIIFVSDEDQGKIHDGKIFDIFKKHKKFFLSEYINRHNLDQKRIKKIIQKIKNTSVIIFGDCIVDEYLDLKLLGNSQEDGLPVYLENKSEKYIGGSFLPAQIAQNLSSNCIFISAYKKEFDEYLLSKFDVNVKNLGLDECIEVPIKKRFRYGTNNIFRLSQVDRSTFTSNNIDKRLIQFLDSNPCKIALFFDFGLGLLSNINSKFLVSNLKKRNIFVGADSQTSSMRGDIKKFIGVNILTPTELELRDGISDHHSGLKILMEKGKQLLDCKHLITTLSENGLMIISRSEKPIDTNYIDFIPALADKINTVSGAGDIFLTVTSMALENEASIWEAAFIGSIAACIRVEKGTVNDVNINNLIIKLSETFELVSDVEVKSDKKT